MAQPGSSTHGWLRVPEDGWAEALCVIDHSIDASTNGERSQRRRGTEKVQSWYGRMEARDAE